MELIVSSPPWAATCAKGNVERDGNASGNKSHILDVFLSQQWAAFTLSVLPHLQGSPSGHFKHFPHTILCLGRALKVAKSIDPVGHVSPFLWLHRLLWEKGEKHIKVIFFPRAAWWRKRQGNTEFLLRPRTVFNVVLVRHRRGLGNTVSAQQPLRIHYSAIPMSSQTICHQCSLYDLTG